MIVAIPTTALAQPLVVSIDAVAERLNWKIIRASEAECSRMLLANTADVALLTPLGYGEGVGKVDYRIIPGPSVLLHDFTNVAGVTFSEGALDIQTATSSAPADWLIRMGALLLAEKFEIRVTMSEPPADCTIDYAGAGVPTIDVSEEYGDITDGPLPAYIWVARMDADLDTLTDAIQACADPSLTDIGVVEQLPAQAEHFPREGRITFRWTDETEDALDAALNLLFFHQILPEIPAVKLLGRD
ncbi:MAG: hypothetical protein MUC47_01205 [Candidatus Kapabacteria bacterium]|jgi:hypothetical protein|nr:hypothetical protein [Candidatus Kapabacteria bacterium]